MNKKAVIIPVLAAAMALSACGQLDQPEDKANGASGTSFADPGTSGTLAEDTSVTEEDTSAETSETTTAAPETSEVTTAAGYETVTVPADSGEHNIIPGIELGDMKDDVLAKFGTFGRKVENSAKPSTSYSYYIDGLGLFGADMKGEMFFEFADRTGELICYGYELGGVPSGDGITYPCSHDELESAYGKVTEKLAEWYGGEPETENDIGVEAQYTAVLDDTSEIWAVYGTDLWGEGTGINAVIFSRSVSEEKLRKIIY